MKKKLALIIMFLLILIAVPATVYLVKQRQELREKAAGATTLYLEPTENIKNVGDRINLQVKMNTESNYVAAAELHLTFSPSLLRLESIQAGDFLSRVLLEPTIDNDLGKGSIILGYQTGTGQAGGAQGNQQTLATLVFTALAATEANTPTYVRFDRPPSKVVAGVAIVGTEDLDKGTDVLIAADQAAVIINAAGGPTPSPSPSSTPDLNASPSPTPSATPGGASPSPTPGQVTQIIYPVNGSTINVRRPVIRVETFADALVTLSISNTTITASSWANASGDWSFTPATDLANGTYTITVTATDDATDRSEAASSTFTVSVGGSGGDNLTTPTPQPSPTPSAGSSQDQSTTTKGGVPTTGVTTPTWLFIILGSILLLFGLSAV